VGLIEDLLNSVRDRDCLVKRVAVGRHWIVVESRHTGMAHKFKSENNVELEPEINLIGKSAFELAELLLCDDQLQASLGLAALNSLIDPVGERGNVFTEVLRMADGKTVTIVGRFDLNKQVAQVAKQVYVLELHPEVGELPPEASEEVIPLSDIVVITATTLINKTLQHLLELSANAFTVILGPSTPINDILFHYGVNLSGGVRVTDTDSLVYSVMQGKKKFKELEGVMAVLRSVDDVN
jgi:uncharacterized protein (DUF4213/DUF364 family)